jgi:WD40 repeat protein
MGLNNIYAGRQMWTEMLGNQDLKAVPRKESIALELRAPEYRLAAEAGLGALQAIRRHAPGASTARLELAIEKLAGGLAALQADFHPLLGDTVWKLQMQQQSLNDLLQEVRLAEFEREARAFRARAERAYLNGWHEEALDDFLEAAKRNYPDYAVHRSIAQLYLYHLVDLPKALDAFRKAAKHALPIDPKQSAEAHYFAGVVSLLEQQLEAASDHLRQATELDPALAEAHYQRACVASMLGRSDEAVASLACAIEGDARYYERAKSETAFQAMRPQIRALLDRLMQPVKEKVAEVKHDAERLRGYVIARPVEEKIADAFHLVERQMADSPTYRTGLQLLETLSQIQQELRGLHDRYYKQYEIDPRDYVRSVAFSNDGRLLASGFLNGGLQVWEAGSGVKLYSLLAHQASVVSVAFSPNNLLLATGSRDNTIKLWEADTGAELQVLRGHRAEVSTVAFSPDGQWLASASHDRSLKIWRVVTGREAQTLAGHEMQATAALWTPDGQTIVSGGWDRCIRLWNVSSGKTMRTLIGHAKGVASLAVSPDGRRLASGGEDATVRLWDLHTGAELQRFSGHGNGVTSVAFSPDGELLAAGCLGQIVIVWKLATGEVVEHLKYENISYNSVAFSPRGQWLALGSRDLQLWLKAILTEDEYAVVKESELKQAKEKSLPVYVPIQAR